MINLLEDNRNFLNEYGQGILDKYDSFTPDFENYELAQSKNGYHNISIKKNGKKILLHSLYDPDKESENFVDGIDLKKDVIVIIGFGLGYHIEMLSSLTNKEIIVIEPDFNIFYQYLNQRRIEDLFLKNKVTVFFETELISISKIIANKIHQGMDVGIYFWNSHKVLFSDLEKDIVGWVKYSVEDQEINTRVQDITSDIWIGNFTYNLPVILKSQGVGVLDNAYKNVPAVIVCAGPSLNKNIEVLKEYSKKALLFSTGSAIGPLANHGIKPHFTVGLDGWETNMKIYNEDIDISAITLLTNLEFYCEVVDRFHKNGNNIFFYTCGPFAGKFLKEEFGKDIKSYSVNFSVSYNAIQMAYTMGCNPIIIVGQDLCFYEKNYADGAAYVQEIPEDTKAAMNVTSDINGNAVYTNRSFEGIRTIFEVWALQNNDRTFFNCTEGGLNINGFENKKLSDVAKENLIKEVNFTKNDEYVYANDWQEQLVEFNDKLQSYYDRIDSNLEECKRYLEEIPRQSININIENAYKVHNDYKDLLNNELYNVFRMALSSILEAYISKYNRETKDLTDDLKKVTMAFETYEKAYLFLQYKYKLILQLLNNVIEGKKINER